MVTAYTEGLEAERDALIEAQKSERQSWSELAAALNRKSENDERRIAVLENMNSNLAEQNALLKKQYANQRRSTIIVGIAALVIGGVVGAAVH